MNVLRETFPSTIPYRPMFSYPSIFFICSAMIWQWSDIRSRLTSISTKIRRMLQQGTPSDKSFHMFFCCCLNCKNDLKVAFEYILYFFGSRISMSMTVSSRFLSTRLPISLSSVSVLKIWHFFCVLIQPIRQCWLNSRQSFRYHIQ